MGAAKEEVGEERKPRKRDDPFYGLNGYRDAPEIRFVHKDVFFPTQITMFDGEYTPRGLMNRQGYFYERVAHARYDGRVKNVVEVVSGGESGLLSYFDLIEPNGIMREVKSVESGSSVKLMDHQASRQARTLANGGYAEFFYEIIRHKVRNIQFRFGGQKDIGGLFSEMRDRIQAWLSLDFSIIFEAWNPRTTKLKRYIPKDEYWSTYGSYTSLRSSIVTRLIKEPEQGAYRFEFKPRQLLYRKKKILRGVNY